MRPYTESSLRVKIDGSWTVDDFAKFLRSLEDVYNLTAILSIDDTMFSSEIFPLNRRHIRRVALQSDEIPPLLIPRISYASPGFADLAGLGKGLEQLKDFILGVTDRVIGANRRRREDEASEIANQRARAEFEDYKKKTEADRLFEKESRALVIHRTSLENLQLAEEVRAATLRNVQLETKFSETFFKLLRNNNFDSDEQRRLVHWIGSRTQPIEELAKNGKLIGLEDVKTTEAPSER